MRPYPSYKKEVVYIVAPKHPEEDSLNGKSVRLSIVAETEASERRDSIMTPSVRLSDETRKSIQRKSTLSRESMIHDATLSTNKDLSNEFKNLAKTYLHVLDEEEQYNELLTKGIAYDQDDYVYDPDYVDPFVLMKEVQPYATLPYYKLKHNLLPPKAPGMPKHTLVLDLDETLVHCYLSPPEQYDLNFQITEGEQYEVYLCFRPYVFHFLKTMSVYYELVVFTAGIKPYAEMICSFFNSETKLIQHCLNREHAVNTDNGMYIKDLRALNRDLATTVILDNSRYAFAYNVDNGVPIESWYCNKNDKELYKYIPMLKLLAQVNDVRPSVREAFKTQMILDNY